MRSVSRLLVSIGLVSVATLIVSTVPSRAQAPGARPAPQSIPSAAPAGSVASTVRAAPPSKPADAAFERVTLGQAVQRALAQNPSATIASLEIARAEALIREARSGSLPTLTANGTYTRLDADRTLPTSSGTGNASPPPPPTVISAKDQLSANLTLTVPLFAPQRWVQWSHAATNLDVVRATSADTRRAVAFATARAYLAVVSQKRVVDITERALSSANAHAAFAHTRLTGGVGNRVDDVRAAQQVASTQSQLASSYTALTRAREALGVLAAGDTPLDAAEEVTLTVPPGGEPALDQARSRRSDIVAAGERTRAAEEVRKDGWADYSPTLIGQFQPFYQEPKTLTMPKTGWQAFLTLSIPLYDGGLRYGQKKEREALVLEARAQYENLVRQSKADVRTAVDAAKRADEALLSATDAASLAHQALELATLAYRAGATTNIEVIDAERQALDADTAAAVAEDTARQARLDLLAASGGYP